MSKEAIIKIKLAYVSKIPLPQSAHQTLSSLSIAALVTTGSIQVKIHFASVSMGTAV